MWSRVRECNRSNWNAGKYGSVGECDQGCVNDIEECQRISGVVSRKLLTNIRSHTIGFLYYLMAVLVAISIPIFTNQLEKAREATDVSNIRSAYAEIATALVADDLDFATGDTLTVSGGKKATVKTPLTTATGTFVVEVENGEAKQNVAQWQSGDQEIAGYTLSATTDMKGKTKIDYTFTVTTDNTYLSKIDFA